MLSSFQRALLMTAARTLGKALPHEESSKSMSLPAVMALWTCILGVFPLLFYIGTQSPDSDFGTFCGVVGMVGSFIAVPILFVFLVIALIAAIVWILGALGIGKAASAVAHAAEESGRKLGVIRGLKFVVSAIVDGVLGAILAPLDVVGALRGRRYTMRRVACWPVAAALFVIAYKVQTAYSMTNSLLAMEGTAVVLLFVLGLLRPLTRKPAQPTPATES